MLRGLICAAVVFCAMAAYANAQEQQWEVGAIGGFGYSPNLTVSNSTTSASTGVKTGLAVGVYGGEDMYRYWSGEASYLYRAGDLKLDGSGKSASFGIGLSGRNFTMKCEIVAATIRAVSLL